MNDKWKDLGKDRPCPTLRQSCRCRLEGPERLVHLWDETCTRNLKRAEACQLLNHDFHFTTNSIELFKNAIQIPVMSHFAQGPMHNIHCLRQLQQVPSAFGMLEASAAAGICMRKPARNAVCDSMYILMPFTQQRHTTLRTKNNAKVKIETKFSHKSKNFFFS